MVERAGKLKCLKQTPAPLMRRQIPILAIVGLLAGTLAVRSEPDTSEVLYTRSYRIDPGPLFALDFPELVSPTPTEMVQAHLERSGVQFKEGTGRKLFYNDRTGVLLLRATLAQFDLVEKALQELNVTAPQVQIETRIAEYNLDDIPADLAAHLDQILRFGDELQSAKTVKASVITSDDMKLLVRALEQTTVDLISAPIRVTISGRQARVAIEEAPPVVTDPPFTAPGKAMKAKWSPNPSASGAK